MSHAPKARFIRWFWEVKKRGGGSARRACRASSGLLPAQHWPAPYLYASVFERKSIKFGFLGVICMELSPVWFVGVLPARLSATLARVWIWRAHGIHQGPSPGACRFSRKTNIRTQKPIFLLAGAGQRAQHITANGKWFITSAMQRKDQQSTETSARCYAECAGAGQRRQ